MRPRCARAAGAATSRPRWRTASGTLPCYFYGQSFLARTLKPGTRVVVSGEISGAERQMLNPMFEVIEGDLESLLHAGRLVPVHALTRGVTARGLRQAVRRALDTVADQVSDPVPPGVVSSLALMPLGQALRDLHFPASAVRARSRAPTARVRGAVPAADGDGAAPPCARGGGPRAGAQRHRRTGRARARRTAVHAHRRAGRRGARRVRRSRAAASDASPDRRRRGQRQDRGGAARGLRRARGRTAGGAVGADRDPRPPARGEHPQVGGRHRTSGRGADRCLDCRTKARLASAP